jgi:hypothetical protein
VVAMAREFLIPAATAARTQKQWTDHWAKGGPWRPGKRP